MATLWVMFHLLFLLSSSPGSTHNIHGLSCLNDYINNITCVWNSSGTDPNLGCRLLGTRENYKRELLQSGCDLKPLDGLVDLSRGCSFVFEDHEFSSAEYLSSMKVECNGSEIASLEQYHPIKHIKMHPPANPVFVNGTNLTFSAGNLLSKKIYIYQFQVQLKREDEPWNDTHSFIKTHMEPWIDIKLELPGLYHIRVRVRATEPPSDTWSDWSPTVEYRVPQTFIQPDITIWLVLTGVFTGLLMLFLLVFYKTHNNNRKCQYVPDPAKYFHTLNSVHGGDFQKWLSPPFAPEAFNPVQAGEDTSNLEVSETEVCDLSHSSFSTTVAVLQHPDPDAAPEDSSSQSSFFSNVGYFYSNHTSGLCFESCPVYFTYRGDEPSLLAATSSSYERLQHLDWPQREPQSPDSGFGMENGEDPVEEEGEGKKQSMMVHVDHHSPPLLVLTLSWPAQMSTGPQQTPSVPQLPLQITEIASDTVPCNLYSAWPVDGALGRSSSMTVEPTCSGYLTVKELQNTYSNKSI
ncbi:interleukin-2 receptor subunit beta [Esox lucius]|uniref:Interleukin-2 receptor subunit beta N-terminal domain-containing protein n=1 Tax=Esox lucius TaxID=8010 RepID=A0A3P8Y1J2_ESOLU|nr:interleukin-2 receptor subunit beta [Esox lucius]